MVHNSCFTPWSKLPCLSRPLRGPWAPQVSCLRAVLAMPEVNAAPACLLDGAQHLPLMCFLSSCVAYYFFPCCSFHVLVSCSYPCPFGPHCLLTWPRASCPALLFALGFCLIAFFGALPFWAFYVSLGQTQLCVLSLSAPGLPSFPLIIVCPWSYFRCCPRLSSCYFLAHSSRHLSLLFVPAPSLAFPCLVFNAPAYPCPLCPPIPLISPLVCLACGLLGARPRPVRGGCRLRRLAPTLARTLRGFPQPKHKPWAQRAHVQRKLSDSRSQAHRTCSRSRAKDFHQRWSELGAQCLAQRRPSE